MNIWKCNNWKEYYSKREQRSGIKIDFDKEVDSDVKSAIKNMLMWVRKQYNFPLRIRIYVKKTVLVKAKDGEKVPDLFFWPYSRDDEPYIKIATGDYPVLLQRLERDDALATILIALLEELTHYFQWLNGLEFTSEDLQEQATICAREIMNEYSETTEHL